MAPIRIKNLPFEINETNVDHIDEDLRQYLTVHSRDLSLSEDSSDSHDSVEFFKNFFTRPRLGTDSSILSFQSRHQATTDQQSEIEGDSETTSNDINFEETRSISSIGKLFSRTGSYKLEKKYSKKVKVNQTKELYMRIYKNNHY